MLSSFRFKQEQKCSMTARMCPFRVSPLKMCLKEFVLWERALITQTKNVSWRCVLRLYPQMWPKINFLEYLLSMHPKYVLKVPHVCVSFKCHLRTCLENSSCLIILAWISAMSQIGSLHMKEYPCIILIKPKKLMQTNWLGDPSSIELQSSQVWLVQNMI